MPLWRPAFSTVTSLVSPFRLCSLASRATNKIVSAHPSTPAPPPVSLRRAHTMASALTHSPPTSPSASADRPDAKKARIGTEASTSAAVSAVKPSKKADKKKARKSKTGRRLMPDEAIMKDIEVFLGSETVNHAVESELDWDAPAGLTDGVEVELRVGRVGSGGEGISLYTSADEPTRSWAVMTPFALPDELIRVRIRQPSRLFSKSDLLEVIESSELRIPKEDIKCQYFGKCGGCQFQNITYDTQLLWKRETVKNAFAHFSKLNPDLIPDVLPTIPSPKTFGYRTKITPHFSSLPAPIRKAVLRQAGIPIPGKHTRAVALPVAVVPDEDSEMADANGGGDGAELDGTEETVQVVVPKGGPPGGGRGAGNRFFPRQHGEVGKFGDTGDYEFKIGFDEKGGRSVMDIEECVLATPVINRHYAQERLTTAANIALFPRNSTLLLRDGADPRSFDPESGVAPSEESNICVTDHKATMHERVGSFHFTFPAGSFFQNNNSILVPLTSYVRDAIFPSTTTSSLHGVPVTTYPPPTHLVDTYCGSGLFGITLSQHFEVVTGVEIDPKSIAYAKANAKLNGVEDKCSFLAGKSEEIFAGVGGFPWEKTAIVLDPPRKGCDEPFLKQLIEFHPQTVVYVSCNVHTQARDIGYLLSTPLADGRKYVLESLRGFDLFPQTAHVEGVAVLRLVEMAAETEATMA